jgi:hypothetical protein
MNRTAWIKLMPEYSFAYCSERLSDARTWRAAKHKATLRHGNHNVSWYVYSESDAAPDLEDALYALSCVCDDGEASANEYYYDGIRIAHKRMGADFAYSLHVRERLGEVLGDAADSFLDSIRN